MKTFIAEEPKILWTILFFMAMTYAYALEGNTQYFAYAAMAVSFLALTTRYHLTVEEDRLVMIIKVAGMKVRTKQLQAMEITNVHQIIAGSKVIFIVTGKSGQQMKIHRFKPHSFEQEVSEFVDRNELQIKQTITKERKQ
ncbi:hypothetical protein [Alkalihalophilus marmarensis]|uniref:PH domain-containing protein n=1 Tax=Alkalihalophilus marmarensis DSM 21297 TaxID=1188261 RepID=U6SNG8_9BACI|nr:hypothetical protein [Alkalihalophilus marmarensis]ERN52186.1 hypothetical protein A33I_16900 [Alkalihalophilus marmarensis DSM 21297]